MVVQGYGLRDVGKEKTKKGMFIEDRSELNRDNWLGKLSRDLD